MKYINNCLSIIKSYMNRRDGRNKFILSWRGWLVKISAKVMWQLLWKHKSSVYTISSYIYSPLSLFFEDVLHMLTYVWNFDISSFLYLFCNSNLISETIIVYISTKCRNARHEVKPYGRQFNVMLFVHTCEFVE